MPTLSDIGPVARTLAGLVPGVPRTHEALTVVPLLAPLLAEPDWLTLAEAGDRVQITEVDQAGAVPHLRVTSRADRPLLLLDGEELVGAKQNRVLNTTVLVAAASAVTIPVSCVEQGRWAWRTRGFASGAASLYASLRAKKAARVSQSLRAGLGHQADQGEVWEHLAARLAAKRVPSPTGAMHDFYLHHEEHIARAQAALAPAPGQAGALVYLAGGWAGLDLLPGPGLFARAWPRLLAGYAADAVGLKPRARQRPAPANLLDDLSRCPVALAPAVALGEEVRLEGRHLAGAALVAEDRVAHLMAFPRPAAPGAGSGGRRPGRVATGR
jgi:hypothetical protein